MPIKRSPTRIRKKRVEVRTFDGDFGPTGDLGTSETLSAISSATITPEGPGNSHAVIDSSGVSGTSAQATVSGGKNPFSVTATNATNLFTASGHGLSDGDLVHLVGGSLPKGLSEHEQYKVISVSGDDFQLETDDDEGGTGQPISFSTDGTNVKVATDYLVAVLATTSAGQSVCYEVIVELRE